MAETTSTSGKAGNGNEAPTQILTYRYRVKSLAGELNRHSRAMNFVWNYCNDAQKHAVKWGKKWPTAFDLMSKVAGSSKDLRVGSNSLACVCKAYEKSRRETRKRRLRYRGRRSLGWVPFRANDIRIVGDAVTFLGKTYRVFNSRGLPVGAVIKDGGSFAQDALGRWYLNVCIAAPVTPVVRASKSVGIDLGLKTLATLSNGREIDHPRFYRCMEERLAKADRARKRSLRRRLYAKCANARRDFIHKATTALSKEHDYVAIGDVPASRLGRTRMAKSIYDAGWAIFKNQLRYKTIALGGTFIEVDESFTTQACSDCGVIGGPKGREGLRVRQWQCPACGAQHQRDVNSALNILARSRHGTLSKGAAVCAEVSTPTGDATP